MKAFQSLITKLSLAICIIACVSCGPAEPPVVNVEKVSVNPTSHSMKVGETVTLTAIVKPTDASNKTIIWSTSDASVATVEHGIVTAIKAGTATITVTTEDGNCTATCTITVVSNTTYAVFGTGMMGDQILPNGIDKTIISEAMFHTSTYKTSKTLLAPGNDNEGFAAIYFELDGTVAHYYTSADYYRIREPGYMFAGWRSLKKLDLSMFRTESVTNMGLMFSGCVNLESLDVSSFDTGKVETMTGMFENCRHLKSLDISHFTSSSLIDAGYLFFRCLSLTRLDLGTFEMPQAYESSSWYSADGIAQLSRNCGIRCSARTRSILCERLSGLQDYLQFITWFLPDDVMPEFEPHYDPDLYRSSDFSMDKKVKMLHTATKGNGIDLVLMGDVYSDRLIADGTYDNDMVAAMDAIFSHEPFKSYKELFNVYLIYAVSTNERLGGDSHFDSNVFSDYYDGGADNLWYDITYVRNYAMYASKKSDKYLVFPVLLIHLDSNGYGYSSSCSTEYGKNDRYDYPAKVDGVGVVFRGSNTNEDIFRLTVCHAFGGSFAALANETAGRSTLEDWEVTSMKEASKHVGWWPNVDFTSEPDNIKWSRFLQDSRYDSSHVTIIEGARNAMEIWRSVDKSIMNYHPSYSDLGDYSEYSVPSREAIYKKIHKLAYGEDWKYDYETFVQQDLKNNLSASQSSPDYAPYPLRVPQDHHFTMKVSSAPDGGKIINARMGVVRRF